MRNYFNVLALIGCSVVSIAAHAGVTHVRFIDAPRFTDTHLGSEPMGDVLVELEQVIVSLGQQCLPAGQTLDVDVLDVDLAGTGRYVPSRQGEIRLITSSIDAPRITLRYNLSENGRSFSGKEETLRDLAFLEHRRFRTTNESYPYEKRLLRDWFAERFGSACAVPKQAARP